MTVPADVIHLVERVKPLLADHEPELQGAALADLLAIWLAGHVVRGDARETRKLRAELLAEHLLVVEQLTEVNAHLMGTE